MNKKKKKTTWLHKKIIIIKLRDKEHHTFSYGPNLLLNSQPHIYFTVITFTYSYQRKEKRERGESEALVEIEVHRSKASGDRGCQKDKAGGD